MAPIRVALIGLSSNAATSWASAAHLPYLLTARGREKYQIVAVCNSSLENARKAIATYNLPATVKAYGDSVELAKDPNIDLVVCATRVDVHYGNVKPALEAGKDVLCEWPLAHDSKHARELANLAEAKGVKTIVGTQGRLAPISDRLREVIQSGRIGKVLSVEARAFGGLNGRDTAPASLSYFFDRKIGGNVFVIGFGHLFDTLQSIVGEMSNLQGHLHLQRPTINLRGPPSNEIVGTTNSNMPDLIFAHGTLAESPTTQKDAPVHIRTRVGQPWPGEPPLVVRINGGKGELRLTLWGGMSMAFAYEWPAKPSVIEVHDYTTDQVEEVPWEWDEWQNELGNQAKNIGRLYEAYARGEGYPTFEDAARRHEQLDKLLVEFAEKYE
ncbi:GFO-IDH-MocA domain-containing protein [Mycena chlorophos]|uniref:GFO-IDH-MocA domain-containing protein n=1 Tax=Mycena chlorophos TaxID=658473 RepID=A0A8H6W785_MYCCL|nr:GFO-IDH-MocA domain-containing protein [Mycena chlorophos]